MANSYLNRTQGSATNQKKGTFSFWIKRSKLGANQRILTNYNDSNNLSYLRFNSSDQLQHYVLSGGSGVGNIVTTRVFRDTSAWYNIVMAIDTTQATAADRIKFYVNGVQESSFGTNTIPSQNLDHPIFASGTHYIGRHSNDADYFEGYISHAAQVDGTALTPTSFGETDSTSGIWKFKSPSGVTFGNNGYHLKFENSAALGTDSSGNTNTFTVNGNLQQAIDTPSNVYAVLNSLDGNLGNSTFSYGNTRFNSGTNSNVTYTTSTLGMTSGKFYFEAKLESAADHNYIGISDVPSPSTSHYFGNTAYEYGYKSSSGEKKNNNTTTSYGATYTTGDILGCAVDLDNNKVYFSKNGVFQDSGDPTSGATGTGAAFTIAAPSATTGGQYFFCVADGTTSNASIWNANFGGGYFANNAITSNSGAGEQDDGGEGKFQYDVPAGYRALNTKNINTYG